MYSNYISRHFYKFSLANRSEQKIYSKKLTNFKNIWEKEQRYTFQGSVPATEKCLNKIQDPGYSGTHSTYSLSFKLPVRSEDCTDRGAAEAVPQSKMELTPASSIEMLAHWILSL